MKKPQSGGNNTSRDGGGKRTESISPDDQK